jgi:hypothetical protein
MHALAPFVLAALAAGTVHAQVVLNRFGHQVTGQNGTAGEFCWVFDCTPRQLAVAAGETLTLRVNAPFQTFFAIGASLTATNCAPLPGFVNALILDLPVVVLAAGPVSQSTPILACWGGYEQVPFAVPPGLPLGFSFTTQAVADLQGPTPGLAFSVAVRMTVQ